MPEPMPAAEAPQPAPTEPADLRLWLEEVEGADALAWVRERNARTLGTLGATDDFRRLQSSLQAVLDSDAKIADVTKIGELYYNFWKDADHPRGLWRRTTMVEYRKATPAWETVIDLDALAREEDENWVWHGASCFVRLPQGVVALSRGGADADVKREFDLVAKPFVSPEKAASTSRKPRVAGLDRRRPRVRLRHLGQAR